MFGDMWCDVGEYKQHWFSGNWTLLIHDMMIYLRIDLSNNWEMIVHSQLFYYVNIKPH